MKKIIIGLLIVFTLPLYGQRRVHRTTVVKSHTNRVVVTPPRRTVIVHQPTRRVVVTRPPVCRGASFWGPYWYPVGFYAPMLPPAHVTIYVNSTPYYYAEGVYYVKSGDKYKVEPAPIGAVVSKLPENCSTFEYQGSTYFYYAGSYYLKLKKKKYKVVKAPIGVMVTELPEGTKVVKQNEMTYYVCLGVYYQPEPVGEQVHYVVVPNPTGDILMQIPEGAVVVKKDGDSYYRHDGKYYKGVVQDGNIVYKQVFF